ncbi:MAG: response regulator transcription factor [Chloroflexota bacterium]|jgi:DNA-binding NarL/FixJ family response regulator
METVPGQPAPVRVVLVDADDRVRESLCGLICIGDRIVVVGSAGQAEPALDIVRETHPDVVVLDPRLPDVDGGLRFIDRVRSSAPGVRVVVMSGSDTGEQGDVTAAADAFVRKTFRPNDLVAAVVGAIPLAS